MSETTQAPETAAPETEASARPPAETGEAPAAQPDPKPEREPWFVRRIAELTRENHEAKRVLTLAERKMAELTAGGGEREQKQDDPAAVIERRAAEIVQQREFNRACDEVYTAGKSEFADFDATLGNFRALGGLSNPLVEAAIETGEAHKVLYALGKDPDEAQRIMSLSPARMGAALAKIAAKPVVAVQASKAPQPVRALQGGTVRAETDPDKMTMAEFTAWRAKKSA